MELFLSRFAFIFLIYAVITSGYINEILSCQMQNELKTAKYFRHLLGILLVFVFIMLEGGWSFDPKTDEKANNNWSSGNVLHTLGFAMGIYIVFIISSKSKLVPNLIFFALVFLLYALNTQRNYYYERKMISDDLNSKVVYVCKIIFMLALIVLSYGFVDYVGYQKKEYGDSFRWSTFILGATKCKRNDVSPLRTYAQGNIRL